MKNEIILKIQKDQKKLFRKQIISEETVLKTFSAEISIMQEKMGYTLQEIVSYFFNAHNINITKEGILNFVPIEDENDIYTAGDIDEMIDDVIIPEPPKKSTKKERNQIIYILTTSLKGSKNEKE